VSSLSGFEIQVKQPDRQLAASGPLAHAKTSPEEAAFD